MKKSFIVIMLIVTMSIISTSLFLSCKQKEKEVEKSKVTFWLADYEGIDHDFVNQISDAFEAENPQYEMDLVIVDWNALHDKLTTSLAAGSPPDASVIGTRWLLELMDLDAVVAPGEYVSQSTFDNIAPGAMEAIVDGTLMGVPFAAGSRFMALNKSLASKAPSTMEELRELAMEASKDGNYGLIMPGGKHSELSDFVYYFYAAGGEFFDASGKCTVNSPSGVKAMEFMMKLANDDKVVQDGYMSQDRKQAHPVFMAGKAAYVMIGAWADTEYNKMNADWDIEYMQIPPFAGSKAAPLIVTDSIALYSGGKNLEGIGKFLDFLYKDEWKAPLDKQMGFPPVTITAAERPEFQTPMYRAMGEANLVAKGWPLVTGWVESASVISDANQKALLGQMTAKEALDWAAAEVDKVRAE
jgi:multiple sugar transport system substrate-binding protein